MQLPWIEAPGHLARPLHINPWSLSLGPPADEARQVSSGNINRGLSAIMQGSEMWRRMPGSLRKQAFKSNTRDADVLTPICQLALGMKKTELPLGL